jgi:hypothetical protein
MDPTRNYSVSEIWAWTFASLVNSKISQKDKQPNNDNNNKKDNTKKKENIISYNIINMLKLFINIKKNKYIFCFFNFLFIFFIVHR